MLALPPKRARCLICKILPRWIKSCCFIERYSPLDLFEQTSGVIRIPQQSSLFCLDLCSIVKTHRQYTFSKKALSQYFIFYSGHEDVCKNERPSLFPWLFRWFEGSCYRKIGTSFPLILGRAFLLGTLWV